MRSLLLVESFDLHPSNQYIFVRVIPSSFHFPKLCLCQVKSPVDIFSLGELHIVYMDWGHVSFCAANVMCIYLDSLAFILHFFKPVLVCK
jgi:hypothetical protein